MQNMHRPMLLESFFKEPKSKCASKHLRKQMSKQTVLYYWSKLIYIFFFFILGEEESEILQIRVTMNWYFW